MGSTASPSRQTGERLLAAAIVGPVGPDGQQPAGTVTLWDVASGRILNTLEGQTRHVRALAIAPDGKTVASGGWGPVRQVRERAENHAAKSDYGTSPTGKPLCGRSKARWGEIDSWPLARWQDARLLRRCAVGVIDVETGKIDRTLTKTTLTPGNP